MDVQEAEICKKVDEFIHQFGGDTTVLIPILQAIQNEYNYLPPAALRHLALNSDITPARIQSVSSFYSQFRHHPAGDHSIKVCIGTACHVKGANLVYDTFKRERHIPTDADTDEEGVFTIEKVACLGCCNLAPVVQIDEKTYGHVETEEVQGILKDFLLHAHDEHAISTYTDADHQNNELAGEIRLGLGSCCIASGSQDVKNALEKEIRAVGLNINIKHVGCVGICSQVPLLEVVPTNGSTAQYAKVSPEDVTTILQKHFTPKPFWARTKNKINGWLEDLRTDEHWDTSEERVLPTQNKHIDAFLHHQIHIATEYSGILKPDNIDEYESLGGFTGLKNCLQKSPAEIVSIIKDSGLRGRGGGGFPTWKKWQIVSETTGTKYIICNGDEGDPGAFMDRMILESYPYRVIEGMLIGAYATGATKGYFYIRAEYPLAVTRITDAIQKCREKGILGSNILGSSFSFDMVVVEGAGAFVCGEETALIESIEGNRGLPRIRPPFPATEGLWQKPTLINNTETWALVPWILKNGAGAFANIGTEKSKGTKVFALTGKIQYGGLIEVPMGITIKKIVYDIGGGPVEGRTFKAVQIGGPSGGCIPAHLSDTTIDYEALIEAGAMMGSGGLVVLDDQDCIVDIARYFLSFTQDQSCGKCTFCRVGTRRMLDILDKIIAGKGTDKDLAELEELAINTKKGSLCGLGKTAPNPVLTALRYFRHEFEAHLNGKCPAGKCTSLISYHINEACFGCTMCAQRCPVDAIEMKPYELHSVDNEKCIACDICRQVCPVDAVEVN